MTYLGYILLSLVILLLMVLIHEAGHYTAAKILGFTVEEFSIGFGPKLFGKRRKNGELFSVRAFPLGGFCAFLGETEDENAPNKEESSPTQPEVSADSAETNADGAAPDGNAEIKREDEDLLSYVMRSDAEQKAETERSAAVKIEALPPVRLDKHGKPALTFNQQKPWKRIIVLLGGVVFNFLSAFIFSLIYLWAVGYAVPQVGYVFTDADGVPYNDFRAGDIIVAVAGVELSPLDTYDDVMEDHAGDSEVVFTVLRDGEIVQVNAVKQEIIETDEDGKIKTRYTGFGFRSFTSFTGDDAGTAFKYCVPYTFKLSWAIIGSFGQLFTGQTPITSMSGPVGSIKMMADVSAANWRNILVLLPLLASNLAIFNLLPFPALDGARIVFTVIEWIRGKPVNRKVEGMIHAIGLVVLLAFVAIVDILSLAL